jgi:hypothetical protein
MSAHDKLHKSEHATGGDDALTASDVGADVSGAAASAITTHEGGADPHTGYQKESEKGATSGYASLDSGGKIPLAQLPQVAISDTFVVVSQAAMLALTAQTGDVAVRSDLNKTFILLGSDPTVLGNWQELLTPTDAVLSVAGRTGAVVLAPADIALVSTARVMGRKAAGGGPGEELSAADLKTLLALVAADITGGAVAPDIQIFNSSTVGTGSTQTSGTWTKPAGNYKLVHIVAIGGGAGGGSGGSVAASTACTGGGGGGGGGYSETDYPIGQFAATEAVKIGDGGAGGVGVTNGVGNAGKAGGHTSITINGVVTILGFRATGGGAGQNTTTASTAGGAGGGLPNGGGGGTGAAAGAAGTNGTSGAAGGGGGGGGITAASPGVTSAGGFSGQSGVGLGSTAGGAAGNGTGGSQAAGLKNTDWGTSVPLPGSGGSGGGSESAAGIVAGAGASGTKWGGGGGGGGASRAAAASGAGGDGAPGIIVVICT